MVDYDADKNKACTLPVRPSIVVETSPGNHHYWFLLSRALEASQAQDLPSAEAIEALKSKPVRKPLPASLPRETVVR